jgi:hypothetical protein
MELDGWRKFIRDRAKILVRPKIANVFDALKTQFR